MNGELVLGYTPARDARSAGLAAASERWGRLAYGAALAFMANLYASPAFYWSELEKARLGVITSAVCAFAVLMRRVTSGERLRLGGPPAALLFAYAALVPLSYLWTISEPRTLESMSEVGKLMVVYVALANALDSPRRLRTFLIVGALATLAPSIGAIQRWIENDNLIDGYRTAWRGNYADPNRLAMGLVLLLPASLGLVAHTRRAWLKLALAVSAVAAVAAIVLTHSRSGAIALAVALGLTFLRGERKLRGVVLAIGVVAALATLAPQSFWTRSESIADYQEDASFAGRERAYSMLRVIVEERPFTGVGAGAFISAWDRFAPLSAQGQRLIAHNIFMEILGELGIVALALFGAFCVWLALRLWRAASDPVQGVDARVLLAGYVGYVICELVNGYSRSFNLYAAFAAGVALIAQISLRDRVVRKAEVRR